jgi:hypothetical protein
VGARDAGCVPLNPPLETHLLLLKYILMHLLWSEHALFKILSISNICVYILNQKKENKNNRTYLIIPTNVST